MQRVPIASTLARILFVLPAAAIPFAAVPAAAAQSGVRPVAKSAIPDEWFFEGANRPAALRALEGSPAPELEVESWIGTSFRLSEQRGKVVVVDFWATWCGPCMAAIPENVALVEKHGDEGLVFVGVHDANAGFDRAAQVVKERKINYPVAKDVSGGKSASAYRVQFWPTYVVIDRAGTVRAAGLIPGNVAKVVEMLLAEEAPASAAVSGGLPPENYLGGAKRPASLRAAEGKPAPKLMAGSWIGAAPAEGWSDGWRDSVVVLHFTGATGELATRELASFARLADEFASQGVVLAAVADPHSDPKALAAMAESAKPTEAAVAAMVFAVDAMSELAPPAGVKNPPRPPGATADAYGVAFAPTTVVIDRSGKVRAAGIRLDRAKPLLEELLAEPIPARPAAN